MFKSSFFCLCFFCGVAFLTPLSAKDPVPFTGYVYEIIEGAQGWGHYPVEGVVVANEYLDSTVTDVDGYFTIPYGDTGKPAEALTFENPQYISVQKSFWTDCMRFSPVTIQRESVYSVQIGPIGGTFTVPCEIENYQKSGFSNQVSGLFWPGAFDRPYNLHFTVNRNCLGYNIAQHEFDDNGKIVVEPGADIAYSAISITADGVRKTEHIALLVPGNFFYVPAHEHYDPLTMPTILDCYTFEYDTHKLEPNGTAMFDPTLWAFKFEDFDRLSDFYAIPKDRKIVEKKSVVPPESNLDSTRTHGKQNTRETLKKLFGITDPLFIDNLRDAAGCTPYWGSAKTFFVAANTSITIEETITCSMTTGDFIHISFGSDIGGSLGVVDWNAHLEIVHGQNSQTTKQLEKKESKTIEAVPYDSYIIYPVDYEVQLARVRTFTGYQGPWRVELKPIELVQDQEPAIWEPNATPNGSGTGNQSPGETPTPQGPKTKPVDPGNTQPGKPYKNPDEEDPKVRTKQNNGQLLADQIHSFYSH